MLPKLLIYLCVTPLSTVLAACLARNGVLSSAVEQAELDPVDYGHSSGQFLVDRPHHPHKPEEADGTIYEFLSSNPRFTLVTKALNFEKKIAVLLNDPHAHLTFFAPPDEVLRHRHCNHSKQLEWSALDESYDGMASDPFRLLEFTDLRNALDLLDNLDEPGSAGDPEKRKKIIKFILHALLSYHILPSDYDIEKLGLNNTLPTHLVFPHIFDNQPLRMRVEQTLVPPITSINFFSRITRPNILATNGFVHVISHALIPPPSVFQELYMVPEFFSILTSVIQRSDLTELLDLRYSSESGLEGSPLVTVFAPTNRAFEKLPKKLKLFLFSPFGEKVLKKLLQYHIVPDLAFFSDYTHHIKAEDQFGYIEAAELDDEAEKPRRLWLFSFVQPRKRGVPIIKPISRQNYTLETAFLDHTLNVVVDKKRITLPFPGHKPSSIKTKVIVNRQLAYIRDIVALNGAIHVVDSLLDPRKHTCHSEGETWEHWEEWLPQWAEAN